MSEKNGSERELPQTYMSGHECGRGWIDLDGRPLKGMPRNFLLKTKPKDGAAIDLNAGNTAHETQGASEVSTWVQVIRQKVSRWMSGIEKS